MILSKEHDPYFHQNEITGVDSDEVREMLITFAFIHTWATFNALERSSKETAY